MIDLFPVKKNYGMAKKPGLWPLFAKRFQIFYNVRSKAVELLS